MSHGGKRAGAGRPTTEISKRRLLVLRSEGATYRQIAERFGVTLGVIQYQMQKQRQKGAE